jgi:adenylate cyclase
MAHRITVRPGTPEEQTVDLNPGVNTVGRTLENDICIVDKSLSRAHARIDVQVDAVVLEDLGSKNGTFVDGARVTRQVLGEKHNVSFGEVPAAYVREQRATSLADLPPMPAATKQIRDDLTHVSIAELMSASGERAAFGTRLAVSDDSEKLRILLKVSQLLSSPASLDALLTNVLDLAFETLDIDRAAILMVDPVTGTLEQRVARVRKGDKTFSRSIARYVMDHSVAALFSDTRLDPRLAEAGSVLMQSIRTSMCAPIKPHEKVLGVLYVDNLSHPNRFDASDLDFLSAFANQAAIAIDNSMLHTKLAEEAVTRNGLLRFFPPAAILAMTEGGGADLRTVEAEATVLFSDISGYTEMASSMRPVAIIELLNAYFPVMAEIVFRHEGTLEKYIGDALLAVWGVPLPHDNDAERAVLAAIDMQRALRQFNSLRGDAREITVHIGINTGSVAAGNIGSKDYIQYATIGDTTNVASRICGVATAGQIVIDERTKKRIEHRQDLDITPLGNTALRGKAGPVPLFRIDSI